MTTYKAPIRDLMFSAVHLAKLHSIIQLPGYEEATPELLKTVLEEAGKLSEEVLAPLNRTGDIQGVRLEGGQTYTAEGWKSAYQTFIDGGWNGLPFSPDRGGQGLPWIFATATQEIWNSANMAFALCPLLTQGAIEALELHGSDQLKDTYLSKLIAGEWTGTMNLTESQAGTDLAAVNTRAVPQGDHYLVSGQKIFITYGDHDLTDNIIHMVLARTPDAPEGVKGISLFLIPKYLQNNDGQWLIRNDIETVSLEHKLGIHASPTAVLSYGSKEGAIAYLIGEENQGLMYMFTMMNAARHAIGVQGNGVAERAYQQAVAYASERIQSKAIEDPAGNRVTIIKHPDIKRMLMLQKCRIEALRSLGLVNAAAIDHSMHNPDVAARETASQIVDILIPIVKGYATECGLENVSLALQIHGGMGFIEETGVAQFYRDQRITPIYEGTTGIQALDLVGRKTIRDQGVTALAVIEVIRSEVNNLGDILQAHNMVEPMTMALDSLQDTISFILTSAKTDIRIPAAVCEPYLRLWGVIACGWQMAKAAAASINLLGQDGDGFYQAKIDTAEFYFNYEMPKSIYYTAVIMNSGEDIIKADNPYFQTYQ